MNNFVNSIIEGFGLGLGLAVAATVLHAIFHTSMGLCQMNDDEIDDFLAPYKRVKVLEEHTHQNHLLDVYEREYEKKYGVKPITDSASTQLMKEIHKMADDRALAIIQHYFRVKNDWFDKKGYDLKTLKENVNLVNADLARRGSVLPTNGTINIQLKIPCDTCGKHFHWVIDATKLQEKRDCGNHQALLQHQS